MKQGLVFLLAALISLGSMKAVNACLTGGEAPGKCPNGVCRWGFVNGSQSQRDNGVDWHTEMSGGMRRIFRLADEKDVGQTSLRLLDTDRDGVKDALCVCVSNAYPSYYNEVSVEVENFGSLPLAVQGQVLHWGRNSMEMKAGRVYFLLQGQGGIATWDGVSQAPGSAVIEVSSAAAGVRQSPGDRAREPFRFHLLQPAGQGRTYSFSITQDALQCCEPGKHGPPAGGCKT